MNVSQDALEEFIYIVSHDVRADLRALRELPQWIREDIEATGVALDAEISRNMDLLIHRADRLDRMMADLLKYSRIGKAQSFPPTNLSEAFACALDLVKRSQGFDIISDLP